MMEIKKILVMVSVIVIVMMRARRLIATIIKSQNGLVNDQNDRIRDRPII